MTADNFRIKILIGAIVMVVLQLFLAPIISINAIVPNFLMAFTIVCTVARPDKSHLLFAFIMGLLFDLLSNGPVGAIAFAMVVVCFAVSFIVSKIQNINLVISIITIILAIFFTELIYGVFQMSLYVDSSFVDIIAFRVLPCTLYNVILGLIMLPILLRLLLPPISNAAYSEEIDNTRW